MTVPIMATRVPGVQPEFAWFSGQIQNNRSCGEDRRCHRTQNMAAGQVENAAVFGEDPAVWRARLLLNQRHPRESRMFSKPLAVGLLVIACVAAAAGSAYVAVRHNASSSAAAAAPAASPTAASPAVQE